MNKAGMVGTFLMMSAITPMGTKNSQPLILNFSEMMPCNANTLSASPSPPWTNPTIRNTINAIDILGTVVQSMCLICVNKSVPAIAGAKLVVSERGDILSPK